jgi:hypothetical protein
MKTPITVFAAVLCCVIPVHGQTQPSPAVPSAGCYQITSQKWHPRNEDATPIPGRFRLRSELADKRSKDIFQMRSTPVTDNPAENAWTWQPRGNSLWLSWGTGLGGFRGTLTQYQTGEFVGKVKEWCDSRCEWKRRVGTIRIQRTDCPE